VKGDNVASWQSEWFPAATIQLYRSGISIHSSGFAVRPVRDERLKLCVDRRKLLAHWQGVCIRIDEYEPQKILRPHLRQADPAAVKLFDSHDVRSRSEFAGQRVCPRVIRAGHDPRCTLAENELVSPIPAEMPITLIPLT